MFDERMAQKAAQNLKQLRETKPLVHNITNFVVMNYTANALLACGASPDSSNNGRSIVLLPPVNKE